MNNTILITGASRGIGFATAKQFAKQADRVILCGRNEESLRQACEQIDGNVKYLVWDIAKVKQAEEFVEKAAELFGEIHVFVNNAGALSRVDLENDFWSVTVEDWEKVEATNLKGTFFACQAQARYFLKKHIKGHIVNVCSENSFRPVWVPYGITKWGVRGMTEGLGRLLIPYGIVVNGVAPGHTATSLVNWKEGNSLREETVPRGRMASPEEIAKTICFLASKDADNIAGEILISDGGRHLPVFCSIPESDRKIWEEWNELYASQ